MRTLYITLLIILLMAFIIPLHASLAVSPSSPLYTHFAYMFGHANFIHWGINGWCILMVHHQFRFHRLLAAWLCSVLFLRTILPFKVDSRIYSANLRLVFLAINFNTS